MRLCGEVPEHRLLGGMIAADCREDLRESAKITIRRNTEDVVEFPPGVPNPRERGVHGGPGKGECDDLLPAGGERFPENGDQFTEFLCHQGGISVFINTARL